MKDNYKIVLERDKVLIRIPKEGPRMKIILPSSNQDRHFRTQEVLSGKKRSGMVTYRFFGIESWDFGSKVVAKVKVFEKNTKNGFKHVLVYVYKIPRTQAIYDMRLSKGHGNVRIPYTNTQIQFKKR